MLALNLNKKKTKSILKKYYILEQQHGTEKSAQAILNRAQVLAEEFESKNAEDNDSEDDEWSVDSENNFDWFVLFILLFLVLSFKVYQFLLSIFTINLYYQLLLSIFTINFYYLIWILLPREPLTPQPTTSATSTPGSKLCNCFELFLSHMYILGWGPSCHSWSELSSGQSFPALTMNLRLSYLSLFNLLFPHVYYYVPFAHAILSDVIYFNCFPTLFAPLSIVLLRWTSSPQYLCYFMS